MKLKLFSLLSLALSFSALAESQLILPKRTIVHTLEKLSENGWQGVDFNEGTQIKLAAGSYRYVLSLQQADSTFSGKFDVADTQVLYLHKAINNDGTQLYSWVSSAKPNSDEANVEKEQNFCKGLRAFKNAESNLKACENLAANNNPNGVFELAYAYAQGVAVEKDTEKAQALYEKAWQLGASEAAIGAYYLDYTSAKTFTMIADAAQKGDKWAQGAYANHIAFKEPVDLEKAKKFALLAANQQNLDGLATLARIEFTYLHKNGNAIDAAAWLNLLRMSSGGLSSYDYQLDLGIQNSLYETDMPQVMAKTAAFEQQHFANKPNLVVAHATFANLTKDNAVAINFNDDLQFSLNALEKPSSLKLLGSYESLQLTLMVNDEYAADVSFSIDELGGNTLCLYYDNKESALKVTANVPVSPCKSGEIASLWSYLHTL